MTTANINDPASVEELYGFDDYSRDVGENSRGKASVYHGILIAGGPDGEGNFALRRHARAYAEEAPDTGGVFLAPFMGKDYSSFYVVGGAKGAVREQGDIFNGDDRENYARFIERVIATARTTHWQAPMDPNRLKGFG